MRLLDLAFQILKKCKRDSIVTSGGMGRSLGITDFINENGQSPLHLLARNPTAFKSGSIIVSIFSIPARILYR
ncbi:hypothetical protein ACLOJK_026758, partial [Asimina triloba]